jgi:predicted adenine nucleotide alpha hydrolase (AANH) superfamily ATPase
MMQNNDIYAFYYNPNVHPYQEYLRRMDAMKNLANAWDLKVIYRDEYPLETFFQNVVFRESERCRFCYHMRLEATVRVAKKGKFDSFTTSLLYSKRQDHDQIREIGETLGRKFGVPFYYEDFRRGYREGIEISKGLNLYRQQYCGCIYSERDRYYKPKPGINNGKGVDGVHDLC